MGHVTLFCSARHCSLSDLSPSLGTYWALLSRDYYKFRHLQELFGDLDEL